MQDVVLISKPNLMELLDEQGISFEFDAENDPWKKRRKAEDDFVLRMAEKVRKRRKE